MICNHASHFVQFCAYTRIFRFSNNKTLAQACIVYDSWVQMMSQFLVLFGAIFFIYWFVPSSPPWLLIMHWIRFERHQPSHEGCSVTPEALFVQSPLAYIPCCNFQCQWLIPTSYLCFTSGMSCTLDNKGPDDHKLHQPWWGQFGHSLQWHICHLIIKEPLTFIKL